MIANQAGRGEGPISKGPDQFTWIETNGLVISGQWEFNYQYYGVISWHDLDSTTTDCHWIVPGTIRED